MGRPRGPASERWGLGWEGESELFDLVKCEMVAVVSTLWEYFVRFCKELVPCFD
ncbi:hypothetical protein LCGC14_2986120, partial [marine sediment metagenome]